MKQRLFFLVSIILCLAVLTGCGSGAIRDSAELTTANNGQVTDPIQLEGSTAEPLTDAYPTSSVPESSSTRSTAAPTKSTAKPVLLYKDAAKSANDFAFRLTKTLLQSNGKKNFVSSPFSVWLPLAALANATQKQYQPALFDAIGAGSDSAEALNQTAANILESLIGQSVNAQGKLEPYNPLQIANAIFVSKDEALQPGFKKSFEKYYDGSIQNVDFLSPNAVKTVNSWANKHTKGLIKEIVQRFDPATVAAIANAIYFSDRWKNEFNPDSTKKDTFHGVSGDTQASFMQREGNEQLYFEDSKLQAMELRFVTGGAMYILLPKKDSAVTMLSNMTEEYFNQIKDGCSKQTGKFLLPKFEIESDLNLSGSLASLGVPLFDARKAPLTGGLIKGNTPVYISDAVQKAVIKVDEKGTTAAAVTAMMLLGAALPVETKPFEMVCDKPFAFILCAGDDQILFTGVVNAIN